MTTLTLGEFAGPRVRLLLAVDERREAGRIREVGQNVVRTETVMA